MSKSEEGNAAAEPLLVAKDIIKVFGTGAGEVQVLKGVNLDLRPGELTLLMGPSGSGKTTLLSILGCILRETSGQLEIAGQVTQGLSPEAMANLRRHHVGFVFQSYNLFPTLTAVENVMLALDVRGRMPADAPMKAKSALDSVGLSHRIHTYPSKLSGGEKQRVAIARALAGSPSVMLADEPTAALDSENGQAVMQLMSDVSKDNSRAVLAVTHDHRILKYADRIIRIEDGVISTDERPKAAQAVTALADKLAESGAE
ncbi:MAG: ABC transporter ATP-binding protein [Filomicrobium sp.]